MQDEYIQKAKDILSKILYITIASSGKENQPWNSPVYSAFDVDYNFFWASDQNGQHSKNIKENDHIFIVVYDSTAPVGTGGVYIKAKAHALTNETKILEALKVLDSRVGKAKKRDASEFLGEYPRRIYKAVPEKFWINDDGDIKGNYNDIRIEVDLFKK